MNDLMLLFLLVWPLVSIILAPSKRILAYAAVAAAIWYFGGLIVLLFLQQLAGAAGTIFAMMVGVFWMVPIILTGLKLMSFDAWRWLRRRGSDHPTP